MTAGVAAAREGEKGGWTRYGPPSYWSKLGRTRGTRDKRDYIAQQIAEASGVSMSTARREIMPHLAVMTHHCKNRELTVAMTARYDLDADHVSFVTGSGKDTNKVQSIVEDAERLREEAAAENTGGAFEGESSGASIGEDDTGSEEDSADGDQQVTLGGDDGAGGDETSGEDEPANDEKAADDDSQSGLSDFM
jgi:replication factor C large subunit